MVYIIVIMTPVHFIMKGKTPYFYPCDRVEKNSKFTWVCKNPKPKNPHQLFKVFCCACLWVLRSVQELNERYTLYSSKYSFTGYFGDDSFFTWFVNFFS